MWARLNPSVFAAVCGAMLAAGTACSTELSDAPVGRTGGSVSRGTQLLYVEFDGATIKPCADDDSSRGCSQVPWQNGLRDSIQFPAFDHTRYEQLRDRDRDDVVDNIRSDVQMFFADFNVQVVATRPDEGTAYTMMVVGGSKAQIGDNQPTTGGIAPVDCANANTRNIGYVFMGEWRPKIGIEPAEGIPFGEHPTDAANIIAQTVAHEAGHTFGLRHTMTAGEIMHPFGNQHRGYTHWLQGTLKPGEPEEPCADVYGDGQVVDHHELLLETLGAAP